MGGVFARRLIDGRKLVKNILASEEPARCNNIYVRGQLDLRGRRVGVPIFMEGCAFEDEVDFSQAELSSLEMVRCAFAGPLKLDQARLSGWFYAPGMKCPKVSAQSVKIGGDLSLGESKEDASDITSLTLHDARVEGGFRAKGLKCDDITLDGLFVGHEVTLTGARLGGTKSRSISVGTQLNLDGATFSWATFDGMDVRDHADFAGSTFLARASGARPTATFIGAKVGGDMNFRGSLFSGGVALDRARVNGDANFEGAILLDRALLRGIRVGGKLVLNRATFLQRAEFQGASVGGDLSLADGGQDPARFLTRVDFSGATIDGRADLGSALYGSEVLLDGLTYKRTRDPEKVLELLKENPRTSQPFLYLEQLTRQTGQVDIARRAYYEWKKAEWNLLRKSWSATRQPGVGLSLRMRDRLNRLGIAVSHWFLRATVGHGVFPGRLLASMTLLLAVGSTLYGLGTVDQASGRGPSIIESLAAALESLLPWPLPAWQPVSDFWALLLILYRIGTWLTAAVGLLAMGGIFRRYD